MTDDDHPLDDVTVKELLAEQNALLRAIWQATGDHDTEETPMGRCQRCNAVVSWDSRREHFRREHGWHEDMGADALAFEQV